MMQKGSSHFDICFFDIEILEKYINNPKFIVFDYGYRGMICARDNNEDESIEDEYIKNWGMAYKDDENNIIRAVGAFVADLAKLDDRKQSLWKGFLLEHQENYHISNGFIKNLVIGDWVNEVWVFNALLEEMTIINNQCNSMNIPPLFNKTFDVSNKPEGYRNIFLPTIKNYNDFVMTLEKMVVHNISIATFQVDSYCISKIERKDKNGNNKGSLTMLDEWLHKNIKTNCNLNEIIIKPLKSIRKIRQRPAHVLVSNSYDPNYYKKQIELINSTYDAVRTIRLLFSNHPLAKNVEVPEHLISGEGIVNY